jgi:hypothetical protein
VGENKMRTAKLESATRSQSWWHKACNSSQVGKAAGGLQVQGHPELHSKFQASLRNIAGPFLERKK